MEQFWVSNNGEVSKEPLSREQVQEQFIDQGAALDLPMMKVGDSDWKTAQQYGFKKTEEPNQEEPEENEYEAVSPVVFLNGKHFCYVFGKSESERSRISHALADFLNKHDYKPL